MKCSKCGYDMSGGAKFCRRCGAPAVRVNGGRSYGASYGYGRDTRNCGNDAYSPYGSGNIGNGSGNYNAAYRSGAAAGMAVRAAGGIGSTLRSIIIGIIIAAVALVSVFIVIPKAAKPGPEKTIKKMESALNALDQKKLLTCFDQQSQDLYNGSLSALGVFVGINLSEYSDLANGVGGLISGTGGAPKFDIDVNSIYYSDDDHCTADITMNVNYDGSYYEQLTGMHISPTSEEIKLPMVYDDGAWKVSISQASDIG